MGWGGLRRMLSVSFLQIEVRRWEHELRKPGFLRAYNPALIHDYTADQHKLKLMLLFSAFSTKSLPTQ